ncbi:MAG: hypothetical protein HKN19_01060, partial [Halioglobus sp.]|nr:hypothetical protein [Halioglobus sp.]
MSPIFARKPLSRVIAILAATGAVSALAQENMDAPVAVSKIDRKVLEEVYVSARKTEENNQDVSIAVS